MVGWHHQFNGHEFEQALGVGAGQGSLVCYSPWGCKELDMTEWLNWTDWKIKKILWVLSERNSKYLVPDEENRKYQRSPWILENNEAVASKLEGISTRAWKTPWMEEPGRLQSVGSLGVGHDWATSLSLFTFMHWRRKWQPTPAFLPGESQGRGSLVGCRLWGRTESDTTEVMQQQQQQQRLRKQIKISIPFTPGNDSKITTDKHLLKN